MRLHTYGNYRGAEHSRRCLFMSPPRPEHSLISSVKSGTTDLSELSAAHPAIYMSLPKEPNYFVDQEDLLSRD